MTQYCELIFIDEDEDEPEKKTCSRCSVNLTMNFFRKKRMGYTKMCKRCLATAKRFREKYKCIHGREKAHCRNCGGSSFCIHGRQKSQCRDCGGSAFCVHDIRKETCRDCDGSAFCIHSIRKGNCRDCNGLGFCLHEKKIRSCRICNLPKDILIKGWLHHSKSTDIGNDRYNPEMYITKSFLSEEFDRCILAGTKCWYCNSVMNLIGFGTDMITIERLNNMKGHNRDNCVFACFDCNRKHQNKTFFMPQ